MKEVLLSSLPKKLGHKLPVKHLLHHKYIQVYTDDIRDSMGNSEKFVIRCQDDTSTNYADVTLKMAGIQAKFTSPNVN